MVWDITNLEALVLQHSLDGGILSARGQLCLEDDTERAIANDFALGILHLFRLPRQSILDLFANYLCEFELAWLRHF